MSRNNQAKQMGPAIKTATRMSWNNLLCQSRLSPKVRNHSHSRTAFEVDYDRVVFSKPFRRLARKTQVHPLATNDHTHNRLTHSLEVSSVGRSLGKAAFDIAQAQEASAIPATAEDFALLTQAACLAHDIGNTPFGHAGERAIRTWMSSQSQALLDSLSFAQRSDLTLYEGNAQAFRLITQNTNNINHENDQNSGGIALTAATLATILKYPWQSSHSNAQANGKYSVFQSDLTAFDWVVTHTGLLKKDNHYCRHPLTFLVEAADDICNSVIDIEDAIDLNLLDISEVIQSLCTLSGLDYQASVSQLRASAIGTMINECLEVFSDCYFEIMIGEHESPLIEGIQPELLDAFQHINTVAQESIYPFQQNDTMEQRCIDMLAQILSGTTNAASLLCTLDKDDVTTPFITYFNWLKKQPYSEYERLMLSMDFVAGMTDNYAVNLAGRFASFKSS